MCFYFGDFSIPFFSRSLLFSSGFALHKMNWFDVNERAFRSRSFVCLHSVSSLSSSSTLLSNIKSQHGIGRVILLWTKILYFQCEYPECRGPLIDVSNSIVVIMIRLNTTRFKCVCGSQSNMWAIVCVYMYVFWLGIVCTLHMLYSISWISLYRSRLSLCFVLFSLVLFCLRVLYVVVYTSFSQYMVKKEKKESDRVFTHLIVW